MKMKPLSYLTGLRGVAAYSVFFAHAISVFFPDIVSHFDTKPLAYFGISLFFVLSGFVITYNYADTFKESFAKALYSFLIARFARLYPLYILFLLPGIPTLISQHNVFTFITLTQAWNNKYSLAFPPAWSISVEVFFYIIFVLNLPLLNRLVKPRNNLIAALIILVICYTYLYYFWSNQATLLNLTSKYLTEPPNTNSWDWLKYYSPYAQFCSFLIGCMSAKIYMSLIGSIRQISTIESFFGLFTLNLNAILIIIMLIFNSLTKDHNSFYNFLSHQFLYSPFIALLLMLCAQYGGILSKILSTPKMLLAGEISYSVYFLQWIVFRIWGSTDPFINFFLSTIFISALAYGSYSFIEMPMRRKIRNLLISKPKMQIAPQENYAK